MVNLMTWCENQVLVFIPIIINNNKKCLLYNNILNTLGKVKDATERQLSLLGGHLETLKVACGSVEVLCTCFMDILCHVLGYLDAALLFGFYLVF